MPGDRRSRHSGFRCRLTRSEIEMQKSSLHLALKDWYLLHGGVAEAPVDGYEIDVLQDDLLIEIQTRQFHAIRPKLTRLLANHRVRLAHPIAREKWIVHLPAVGDTPTARANRPRHGRLEHLFVELVRIPHLALHPNLTIEVLFTREEEIRRSDGKGSWRRQGQSIADRRLLEVLESRLLCGRDDFQRLLPDGLPQPFTNRDLAAALGIPLPLAGRMTYCLSAMSILAPDGKRGRFSLYRLI